MNDKKRSRKNNDKNPEQGKRRRLDGTVGEDEIEAKFAELKDIMQRQHKAVMGVLATQTAMIKSFLQSGENNDSFTVNDEFPITTNEKLIEINEKMFGEQKKNYISTIKSKLIADVTKGFLSLISKEIILSYNLDGTHGKMRFKDLENFYDAIKEALESDPTVENADTMIRKAFQNVKRAHFKKVCMDRKKDPKFVSIYLSDGTY